MWLYVALIAGTQHQHKLPFIHSTPAAASTYQHNLQHFSALSLKTYFSAERKFFACKYLSVRHASTWRTFLVRKAWQLNCQSWHKLSDTRAHTHTHTPNTHARTSCGTPLALARCQHKSNIPTLSGQLRTLFIFAMLKLITILSQDFIIIRYLRRSPPASS